GRTVSAVSESSAAALAGLDSASSFGGGLGELGRRIQIRSVDVGIRFGSRCICGDAESKAVFCDFWTEPDAVLFQLVDVEGEIGFVWSGCYQEAVLPECERSEDGAEGGI